MNEKKLSLALIGHNVKNSKSGEMHRFILRAFGADCDYELASVDEAGFSAAFSRLLQEKDGINVTIPYKLSAIGFLDTVCGDAAKCGAVNTVITGRNPFCGEDAGYNTGRNAGCNAGYNTDGIGFMQMLRREKIAVFNKRVLVIGAGGAGRSVAAALKSAGADVFLSRKDEARLQAVCEELGVKKAERDASGGLSGAYDIFVNCTGVGAGGSEHVSPVEEAAFDRTEIAVDLIYRPETSEFLRLAQGREKRVLNGKAMLFYQAYYSDCLYLGVQPDGAQADELYEKYLKTEGYKNRRKRQ